MHGGAAQGIGWALLEELAYDEEGQLRGGTFAEYALPSIDQVPPIETLIVEVPAPDGPFGAKGVGEPPVVAAPPAIANAIAAATGARLTELPMTPRASGRRSGCHISQPLSRPTSMTSPKIFFAGATGALGSRLVPLLIERGYDVVAMTRSPGKVDGLRAAGAEPVVADGLDRDAVAAAVKRTAPDVVLHQMTGLADVTSFKDFDEVLAATNQLRIEGTDILLEAARAPVRA